MEQKEQRDKQKQVPRQVPPNPFSDGMCVVVDKPYGRTSFDVVYRFRNMLSRKLGVKRMKVGHAGTLDPLATGVVVLCTGRYTKRIEEIQKGEKEYYATLKLGETTPSYDLEKEVDATYPTGHITRAAVERVLSTFVGEIDQVPPIFSAVKVEGKRSYHLARQGKEVELRAKPIWIREIELLEYDMPFIRLRISCGKGTYIRALARDIGEALDSGAHLTELKRTRVGEWGIEEAIEVEGFEAFIDGHLARYGNQLGEVSKEESSKE